MTIKDIQDLIHDDENRILELKKTTGELKDGMKSACAFLNTDGGWVIFGITPTSLKIIGQQVTDNTKKEIGQEIAKLYPAIDLKPIYIPIPDKPDFYVIAIHLNAWPRGTAPYTYDNRPYIRLESITKVMPREMFEARIRESQPHLYAWERQQADGINIEDLDESLIAGAVRGGVKGGRLSRSALSETTENILSKFQLLNEGKPNNAAVALFAKETGWYTQLELRMARFKGNGKNEFGDNQSLKGNFFKLFDKEQDVPEPTYEDRSGFIHIVFKRKSFSLSDDTKNDTINDTKNDTKKLSIKSVTDRQKRIITILRSNSKTSTEELGIMLSVSKSTILRDIKELNAQGVLAWVGSKKGGHWEFKE